MNVPTGKDSRNANTLLLKSAGGQEEAMRNTDRIVRCLLPEIEGKEVLEVACGTAEFSLSAARWAKRVTCIDIEESRLDERVKKQDNICFRVMDASKMDFEGEAFDTIIVYNAIYHIKDQYDEILEECRRVLKPEGHIFLISTWKLDLALMREKFGGTQGPMEGEHFVGEEYSNQGKGIREGGIIRLGK